MREKENLQIVLAEWRTRLILETSTRITCQNKLLYDEKYHRNIKIWIKNVTVKMKLYNEFSEKRLYCTVSNNSYRHNAKYETCARNKPSHYFCHLKLVYICYIIRSSTLRRSLVLLWAHTVSHCTATVPSYVKRQKHSPRVNYYFLLNIIVSMCFFTYGVTSRQSPALPFNFFEHNRF